MNEEIDLKLEKVLRKSFPDIADDYILVLKARNDVDVNSNEHVKSLINSIYYAQNSSRVFAGSSIVKLTKSLALYLNDKITYSEIEIVCEQTKRIPSYSILESIVQRYFNSGYKLSTKINFGKYRYALNDLYKFYQEKNNKIWEIFIDLIKRNDIEVASMGLPNFENMIGGAMGHDG